MKLIKNLINLLWIHQTSGVEDSIFSSTEDLSSSDDYFQDKDDSTQPENISENEFLPGFCSNTDIIDEVLLKQPECTSRNIDNILPTCSISNLTNEQTTHPPNVKFKVIEDSVKSDFLNILSSPNTFLTGICINTFMVIYL